MVDVDQEIRQLREELHAVSDSELASSLGLGRSAVSQWRKRGVIPEAAKAKALRAIQHLNSYRAAAVQVAELPEPKARFARALAVAFIYRQATRSPDHLEDALPRLAVALDAVIIAAGRALDRSGFGGDLQTAFGILLLEENLDRAIADALLPQ